jgi:hypothetical protein
MMPRKRQSTGRKRKARWKSPPPESIINVESYKSTASLTLDPSVVSTIEFFTQLLFEPADEPQFEIKSLLEDALNSTHGAASSVGELHSMAVQCIKALDILAIKKPELLRAIASKKTVWPTLYSHSPLHTPALHERLAAIGFATETGMTWIRVGDVSKNVSLPLFESAKGLAILLVNSIHSFRSAHRPVARIMEMFKRFYSDPPEMDIAYQDYRWNVFQCAVGVIANSHINVFPKYTSALVDECLKLPSFSPDKSVTDAWWDVGYQLLMLNTNGRPENVREFYEIGRCRERHISGFNATWTKEYYKPEAVKANVRAKILTDLKEEFERVARQLAKTEVVKDVTKKVEGL